MPPYAPLVEWARTQVPASHVQPRQLPVPVGGQPLRQHLPDSIKVAAVSTLLCLLIGYPMAYAIARHADLAQPAAAAGDPAVLDVVPAARVRVDRAAEDARRHQQLLLAVGIIDEPLTMLYTDFAVYIGIVYSYLPFMILPLYANLEKHDLTLLEAAADLGAGPLQGFLTHHAAAVDAGRRRRLAAGVHSRRRRVRDPGAARAAATADDRPRAVGRVLRNRDWPVASAVAIAMLLLLVVPIMLFQRYQAARWRRHANEERGWFRVTRAMAWALASCTCRSCR
jgi:putrescine transport system permease protein